MSSRSGTILDLRWLNEDIILKQRVLNLEHDFSNGYLLGEILHAHNHQHNFHLFQDLETSEAKVNNFLLLEPSLRHLGVLFDAQVAHKIMQGTPGMISRLLYQVKMVLDRLTKFSVPVSMRSTIKPAGVKPLPNLPQRATKPKYDSTTHAIFAAAVRDLVQNQKGINVDRWLQRFEAEGARQKQIVRIEKERSVLAEELRKEAIRMQGIHDLSQRKALCESWEENNVDDWLVNMSRKRDRQLRTHRFLHRVKRAHLLRLQRAKTYGERVVQYDLADFDARARGASHASSINQAEYEGIHWAFAASTGGVLERRALENGFELQMAKFHSKSSEERSGARENRRRKFTTEREEFMSHEHLCEGMDALTQKLMKRCQNEALVERQLASIYRYKEVITENRKFRTQQYVARADVDAEGLLKRDQASLDSFRREYEMGLRAQAERCEAAVQAAAAAKVQRIEKMCREVLQGLFDLSMEVVRYRVHSEHWREPDATAPDQDPMPRLQWRDMKLSFIRGGPLLFMGAASMLPVEEWGYISLLPLAASEGGTGDLCASSYNEDTAEKVARFLDESELQDYINEAGWWNNKSEVLELSDSFQVADVEDTLQENPPQVKGSMKSILDGNNDTTEPLKTEAGFILNTLNPLHALGDCVIEANLAASPLPPPPTPPAIPTFSLRICMCGRASSGKSEQAIRLADRYRLKVLSAEELAQGAMDNAAHAMAAGRTTLSKREALGQEASSALLRGATISDKIYAALLVEAIKEIEEENSAARAESSKSRNGLRAIQFNDNQAEYAGWIIDDFPSTAEQAADLEKHLSGYDENAHVPSRSDASSKLARASNTPDGTTKKDLATSGVDLAIFIDAPRTTILKRNLGRLFDPITAERYHFEGSLPQYDVVCKERLVHPEDPANASAHLSLQVAAQERISERLKVFLRKFGTLREVDSGDCTPDALFGKLNAVVMTATTHAKDAKSAGHELWLNGRAQHRKNHCEDFADEPNGPGIVYGRDLSPMNGTAKLQEAGGTDGNVSELGNGISNETFASATGSRGASQEHGNGLLGGEFSVALSGHWREAELQFEDTARRVFRELRNQRSLIGGHMRSLRNAFSMFLQRPDRNQGNLADFCGSFNAIDQDLRFDDRVCRELLLRTEESRSKLWCEVEERKDRATGILRKIKRDGWLERQQAMISNHMILLMQAEVERFHAGNLLLHDSYHAKVQDVTADHVVALTPLLPTEAEGSSFNDVPTQVALKQDKDAKGGGKKAQDSKNGRGTSDDTSEQASSVVHGGMAWPPCAALSSLVDVVSSGDSSQDKNFAVSFPQGCQEQVAIEPDENATAHGPAKGKADRTKKSAKKHLGRVNVAEAQGSKTPLAAALSAVMTYADAWAPDGFRVPREEEPDMSQADGSTVRDAAVSVQQAIPPKRFLLHRAVWAQAEVLATRCQLLSRVGEALSAEIRKKADLLYAELHRKLDERVSAEAQAADAAIAMAKGCIDSQSMIEYEWKIQGGSFRVDEGFRLVPVPTADVSHLATNESAGIFSQSQVLGLRHALVSVQLVGTEGFDPSAIMSKVMPEDVVDILQRLSADEGALPDCWAQASKDDLIQVSRVLDHEGIGFVDVQRVLSSITAETPSQLLA